MGQGQAIFEAWVAFLSSFVVMPAHAARVLALWCMHTYFVPKWPGTVYVHVTAKGPGLGKSTLLEACAALSLNPKMRPTVRALSMCRDIEAVNGACTFFLDQVEALSDDVLNDTITIMLSGQRQGFKHSANGVEYSVYCGKMFGCIGRIHPDLRTRCLVVELDFGVPSRVWSDEVLTRGAEATRLIGLFSAFVKGRIGADAVPQWVGADGWTGREREILTPLWSMALLLDLPAEVLAQLRQDFRDMLEFRKSVEQRSYRDLRADSSTEAARRLEREYAIRALRDLASVLPHRGEKSTGNLWSEHAVERMRALPDGPWRVFRGKPLDAVTLASLVGPYLDGQATEVVREVPGKKAVRRNGYHGERVRRAVAALEGQGGEQ